MTKKSFLLVPLMALMVAFAACENEESPIGIGLQDPSTLYNGISDTLYGTAETIFEDSLNTTNYSAGLLGTYSDNLFGDAEASIFTQINCTSESGIDYVGSTVDSIVISLAISGLYPYESDTVDAKRWGRSHRKTTTIPLTFEIRQLAESFDDSATYYAFDELEVSNNVLYNGTVTVSSRDSVVYLRLNNNLNSQLSGKKYTNPEFLEAIKGIRIRMSGTEQCMLNVNFAGANTKMTVYRTYSEGSNNSQLEDAFVIGNGSIHFNHFTHNYLGDLAVFNTNPTASIDGSQYLYLDPMGGTQLKLNFNNAIQAFHEAHPYAIIHYAELVMPVAADKADSQKPYSLLALRNYGDTTSTYIADMNDGFTSAGFDGAYNSTLDHYRLRVTQHVQELLRQGRDEGTTVLINARRSSARRTVLNGYNATMTGQNPFRIVLVYSEPFTK